MRHRKNFNHLGRKAPHRKAMLANMASSLIIHKRITTTTAKAKALRTFVEPVITRSKEDTTHSRRIAFRLLRDKNAVTELFRDVSAKVGERPGGYTRIIKLGNRLGDNADMCIIELVDYNENLLAEKTAARSKTTRRRRGGKKKADQPEGAVGDIETTEETETTVTDTIEEAVDTVDTEVATEAEPSTEVEDVVESEEEPKKEEAESSAETEDIKPEEKAEEEKPELSAETEEVKEKPKKEVAEPEAKTEEEAPEEEEKKEE